MSTSVKFKKYESRPTVDLQREVCCCGHDLTSHNNLAENRKKQGEYPTKIIDLTECSDVSFSEEYPSRITKCEKCMCPEFEKVCMMTRSKYLKNHPYGL